ncbi:MAG TPA: efflux RND transporter periplasmic adaptor subunit [Candidatus Angelobacter sp.]|jgi:multidrug efflux pump subunit AcrA (membrane-fusion protein)
MNSPNSSTPLIFLTALAVWVTSGCSKEAQEQKPEVAVQVAAARQGEISRVVNTEAVLFPIAQSVITPKITAPVKKFYVNRGEKVRQGQLLAELENRDLSAATMDNKGALDQAEASYSNSVNAALPEEVQKTEMEVQTAEQELDAAQKLYTSRQELFRQGALPRKDLDAAAVQLAQAKTAYNSAKKHLESLNAVGKQATVKSAGGQLASARGKLMAAEAQLGYSRILSPIDGVVTDRPVYPGEMATNATPLMTVMNISQVIAKAHVPQSDAVLLRKGDQASISLSGSDQKFAATVSLVSPALDPNSTTVEVWVQAANPQQQLRPGMSVQVAITTQTVRNALVIPASALLDAAQGQANVMVVDTQGVAQQREVKTGIVTPDQAQIISGLQPGENVVTVGAYGLPDKTKVKVQQPESAQKPASSEDKAGKDDKD